ncbi:MAG TPA: DUF2924 domain-containing protein [Phycisphaerales bacterium]|nr:DUF2924 domain-containing protein [Phycisphaerales bacterium]HMP37084.1 DUF2924 domain-containing protein [Phycisphaerales bacterium]
MSELERMTVTELRRRYAEVFNEETRSYHKAYLVRRIAWRVQANAEGDLTERAQRLRERALAIADDADLRMRAPGPGRGVPAASTSTTAVVAVAADDRLPMPGALLTREYRGRTIRVRVLPKGFDYEGTIYRSLSAVAKEVTGAHWNGYLFFGLEKPKSEEAAR